MKIQIFLTVAALLIGFTGAFSQNDNILNSGDRITSESKGGDCSVSRNPITVELGPDSIMCFGDTVYLDAGNPGASYLWCNGHQGQIRTVITTGTYCVTVTDDKGCTAETCHTLEVNEVLVAEITGPGFICGNRALSLNSCSAAFRAPMSVPYTKICWLPAS